MNASHDDRALHSFVTGLIIGGLLGAMSALWLAPQSGQKAQQMIRRRAHRLHETAEDAVDDIKDRAEHASEDVREKVTELRHDGQEWLAHQAREGNKTASKIRGTLNP